MSKEEKEHQERWMVWNRQRELETLKANSHQELGNFADKIVEKLNKHMDPILEKSLGQELETNTCGVCTELMISPNEPYILFPCGHSFCKECMYKDHQNKVLKITVCPYCRAKVSSCALNISLLNLIRKYKVQEAEPVEEDFDQESMDIRCNILSKEATQLRQKLQKEMKTLEVKTRVEKTLQDDKNKIRVEMEKLKEEDQLIETHLLANNHEIKLLRQNIETVNEKYLLIEKTLESLEAERDKMRLMFRK